MFIPSTIPGQMAVFSFYRIMVPMGRGARRLVVSTCLLPYSQEHGVWLDPGLNQETLFLRLEDAFHRFRGVPRQLATRPVRPLGHAAADEECPWSRPFLRFCAHFGCEPVAIPCGAPQDTHIPQQVEDLLRQRAWQTLEEAETALQQRVEATGREADYLLPLPARPFVRDKELFRRVASDGFVTVAGDSYSVPLTHTGDSVWVRHSQGRIVIRSQDGTLLATHAPGDGRGTVRLDPRHFETTRSRTDRDLEKLTKAFRARFPHYTPFLERLIAQRKLAAAASLRTVLALTSARNPDAVDAAIAACQRYNNFSHRFFQGFLEKATPLEVVPEDEPGWMQGELF